MIDRQTDTIPKVDRAEYLFETLGYVQEGLSFDEIRRELITLRYETDEERLTGQRAGGALGRRSHRQEPHRDFWSNARDTLRELMRLGLVHQVPLPSRPTHLEAHLARTYELTEEGEAFIALAEKDVWQFRQRFAQAMEFAHPYFRQLRAKLCSSEIFVPRIRKEDIPGTVEQWKNGIPEPLMQLSERVASSVNEASSLQMSSVALESQMRRLLESAWARDTERGKEKAHVLGKWAVKAVNDVVVRCLTVANGLPMDYVTFRSAVALLSDLHAVWHTRALSGRRGWTIWATSKGDLHGDNAVGTPAAKALHGRIWFSPVRPPAEVMRDKIIECFFSMDRPGGFALIHELRANVCYALGVHAHEFNTTLQHMHAQQLVHPTYRINLDRGGGDTLLPSEEPFRVGNRAFYLITLLPRS